MPEIAGKTLVNLRDSIDASRRMQKPYNEKRIEVAAQYVGYHYGDTGASNRTPVNYINQAGRIYRRALTADRPQIIMRPRNVEHVAKADMCERATNILIKSNRLGREIGLIVFDALINTGFARVGPSTLSWPNGMLSSFSRGRATSGRPIVRHIDMGDMIIDMDAKRFDECTFMGNRYDVALEWAKNNPAFNAKARRQLSSGDTKPNRDEQGSEHLQILGRRRSSPDDAFVETVTLQDIWVPELGVIVTLAEDQDGETPALMEQQWPWGMNERPPYRWLSFDQIPSNLFGVGPLLTLYDLHRAQNVIASKLIRQAERQKTFVAVERSGKEDAEGLLRVQDGEVYAFDSPQSIGEKRLGGPDSPSFAIFQQFAALISHMGGNLDSIGGLSPQADTLGQEQLMYGAATSSIRDLQERAIEFVTEVCSDMAWYVWTDPEIEFSLTYRLPNVRRPLSMVFTPEDRFGDFDDFEIDIDVFSMQSRTPNEIAGQISQLFGQAVQWSPMLAQQGKAPDFAAYFNLMAKRIGLPELNQLLIDQNTQAQAAEGGVQGQGGETTRNYVRRNVAGGASPNSGNREQMAAQIMAQSQQQG